MHNLGASPLDVLKSKSFHKKDRHPIGCLSFFSFGQGFEPSRPPLSQSDGEGVGLERDKGENKEYRVCATAYTPETAIFLSGPFKSHIRNQKNT
jgi:hypothetical protein